MGIKDRLTRLFSQPKIAPFTPKIVTCLLEGYSKETFFQDLLAGISVGVIALPLAMAFSIAAGLDPEYGIYTACIAGFLNSLFGGSRHLIGGPTGAYVLLIYGVYKEFGYPGLQAATIEAALIIFALGFFQLGTFIRFVPYPVIMGFSGGIAITIAISQIKDFFGFTLVFESLDPIDRLYTMYQNSHLVNISALTIGLGTLLAIIFIKSRSKRLPAFLIALFFTTAIAKLFELPVITIEDRFGIIPSHLPALEMPVFHFELFRKVFPHALGIALLGAIESLLCAVIADGLAGTTHKSNCELIAQGISNIGSALFHGIPSTGAIARTTANINLGAKTPVAGMIHSITLLLLMLFLAPIASMIPLAALAGVLLYIAWNMIEIHHMKMLLKGSRMEGVIMLTTLITTVCVDLNAAVELGVLLSIVLFVKKSSEINKGKLWTQLIAHDIKNNSQSCLVAEKAPLSEIPYIPHDISVYELEGPFFFAVCDTLHDALLRLETTPRVLIIRMRSVPFIDISGIQAIKRFYLHCISKNIELYLSEIQNNVGHSLEKSHIFDTIPRDRVISNIHEVIE